MTSVGAVVVSYGESWRALRCVESLLEGVRVPERIVVVHNGPGPFECTTTERRVTLLEPPRNLGYGGGLRAGVEELANHGVDYLWFLNNDVVVHANALDELVGSANAKPRVGLWGCTVCRDASFESVAAIGVQYSVWTSHRRPVLGGARVEDVIAMNTEPHLDFLPGSCMFLDARAYQAVGGFSLDYFLYFEELDLAARLAALGWHQRWCRRALVAHDGGATTGSYRPIESRPTNVAYHAMRSAVIFTRRHRPIALPSLLASRLAIHVVSNSVRGHFGTALAAWRGCVAGLSYRTTPGVAA